MDRRNKKDKKNIEEWLLGFEKQIGKSCVVCVLVEAGEIEFLSCFDKKRYLDLDNEEGDDQSDLDLKDIKENVDSKSLVSNYIG